MGSSTFKIVVLTGIDDFSTIQVLEALEADSETEIGGIVYQSPDTRLKIQWRNFKRNLKREGLGYVFQRTNRFVQAALERLLSRIAPPEEVARLLRQSFPDRTFSIGEFASRHGIPLFRVGDINGPDSVAAIRGLNAELGVVVGTKILKERIFSIPKLGCINIHKGKIPEYRGMPVAFWEMYNGETSAAATVHFIDKDLDTGDVIGESVVPIGANDTVETLRRKLDRAGMELLADCVRKVREGSAERRAQNKSASLRPNSLPTRAQKLKLGRKLGSPYAQDRFSHTVKTLFYALLYFSGVFNFKRWIRSAFGSQRCAVILQHRVNDDTEDAITTGVTRFAEHVIVLQKYFCPISTEQLISSLKNGNRLPANGVALHFDDCYRDVYTNASRILATAKFPVCVFVSSGFVDTDQTFEHDEKRYSGPFLNLSSEDVRNLLRDGAEIGSHTVNHVDLGKASAEDARYEVFESKKQLEAITGQPIRYFSFPYGKSRNTTELVRSLVVEARYDALFSAHGGFVNKDSDPYRLQRFGVHGALRPIDLLAEIEGLSLGSIRQKMERLLGRK